MARLTGPLLLSGIIAAFAAALAYVQHQGGLESVLKEWTPPAAPALAKAEEKQAGHAERPRRPVQRGQQVDVAREPVSEQGPSETAGIAITLIMFIQALPVLITFFMIIATILFFMLPSYISMFRGHSNTAAIVVLNILLGWTCIGWIAALVWAFTAARGQETHHYYH
jgi:hypothetical protein